MYSSFHQDLYFFICLSLLFYPFWSINPYLLPSRNPYLSSCVTETKPFYISVSSCVSVYITSLSYSLHVYHHHNHKTLVFRTLFCIQPCVSSSITPFSYAPELVNELPSLTSFLHSFLLVSNLYNNPFLCGIEWLLSVYSFLSVVLVGCYYVTLQNS